MREKVEGSRKVKDTPRRFNIRSVFCFVVESDLDLDLGDNADGGVNEEEISLEPCSSVVVLVEVVLVVQEVDKVLKMALSWSCHNQDSARLTWNEKPNVTSHQCCLL